MSTVHSKYNHLGRKRQRSDTMPVAMHYPRLTETACCDELMHHQHSNLVRVSSSKLFGTACMFGQQQFWPVQGKQVLST